MVEQTVCAANNMGLNESMDVILHICLALNPKGWPAPAPVVRLEVAFLVCCR